MKRSVDLGIAMMVFAAIISTPLGSSTARADFTFGEPVNMGPLINSEKQEWGPCISADGLEFYISSNRDGGVGGYDLWVSTRQTTDDPWGQAMNLGELINSAEEDGNPTISSDGLELYFNSPRPGGLGGQDVYVATRTTTSDSWGPPMNLGAPVNSPNHDSAASVSGNGLELYFKSTDPNGPDFFVVTRREAKDTPWGEPVTLGPVVNSWDCSWECEISGDGLLLMWNDYWDCDPRPGGYGETDIWFSWRATPDDPWGEPTNLGPTLNTAADEGGPEISLDGTMLYFSSNRPGSLGNYDFWQAPILPMLDFDADSMVGFGDLLMLTEAWGTDNRLCDIGPMPWGDGVVDDADLEVLMAHYDEPMSYPHDPRFVRYPSPSDGQVTAMDGALPLSWTPAEGATEHSVYFGMDPTAVSDADASDTTGVYRGTTDTNEYSPIESVEPGQTYYWRIDEHDAPGDLISKGPIWTFTVGEFLIVDDFESYTDEVDPNTFAGPTIWNTWIDAYFVWTSGAIVGYMNPPFAETAVVHGGAQAMPFFYDNDGTLFEGEEDEVTGIPYYSEAQRTWDEPQDWTREGVEILSLWLYGELDNSPDQFYVGLEDNAGNRKDIEHPDPGALTIAEWQQWSMPLTDFTDVDPTAIKIMYIGTGDPAATEPGGSGLVRIDDIELHRPFGQ